MAEPQETPGVVNQQTKVGASTNVAGSAGTATVSADITVDATAGGVALLAGNTGRKGFIISNAAAAGVAVRIRIGADPSTTQGVRLDGGQTWTFLSDSVVGVPTGQVKAIREGGTSAAVSVTELT